MYNPENFSCIHTERPSTSPHFVDFNSWPFQDKKTQFNAQLPSVDCMARISASTFPPHLHTQRKLNLK
ncbi:unnamed protein product [Nippostrongylus brasiliensis]|uniref:Ovule protein n=1 Tax=Nippostrongylus brasiliensis TaxID=27835 RepID=A0A0N4XDI4_NIPBR|nr:unnamed protein product [Nippostrongylus brasiliensis]